MKKLLLALLVCLSFSLSACSHMGMGCKGCGCGKKASCEMKKECGCKKKGCSECGKDKSSCSMKEDMATEK